MPEATPKKLIEVALPLVTINQASAKEKAVRHGHPSTLHLWWARRPLASARAMIFAALVDDPGGARGWGARKGQTREAADAERAKLFRIVEQLADWENSLDPDLMAQARRHIEECCGQELPTLVDPFAGGGTIPLEAHRLGLPTVAQDLNPVAVLINKAVLELAPRFRNREPVGPTTAGNAQPALDGSSWERATGLAEDVRRIGAWMRERAFENIGRCFPRYPISGDLASSRPDLTGLSDQKLPVVAWIWARTVASPNPAANGAHVPLVSSYWLSGRKGDEAWLEPKVDGHSYEFVVRTGPPTDPQATDGGTKAGRGSDFTCLLTGSPISGKYIKAEGKAGRLGSRLIAVVAKAKSKRVFLPAIPAHEDAARSAQPKWRPEGELPSKLTGGSCYVYGLTQYADIMTERQLLAVTTYADLVREAGELAKMSALESGWSDDGRGIEDGGDGATAYGEAVATLLAFCVDKLLGTNTTICTWQVSPPRLRATFSRQALPMTWDFAEANPFGDAAGDFAKCVDSLARVVDELPAASTESIARQANAQDLSFPSGSIVVVTDPPYYDNISYAALSDIFYVWLRHSLRDIYPKLFSTLLTPKSEELIADRHRHGGRAAAESFFLENMTAALTKVCSAADPRFPICIYYAFKQAEVREEGVYSTGWETFLAALLKAGFSVTGTWPVRTEWATRSVGRGTNALASSIVIVCRKREAAEEISRRQFLRALEQELPEALRAIITGPEGESTIAPVDLAQAAIGPGMAVFSRHAAVLEADGSHMTVHSALVHINKAIDEFFTEAEGEMGADTRFCVDWFQQYGFSEGPFGEADVLARAKGTSVDGVDTAGVIESGKGKVRLLQAVEYPSDWDPLTDKRTPIWEACHQLCRALQYSEFVAGELLAKMPDKTEPIRQLAYRLYTLCERKGWAKEAGIYNELITSWHSIVEASQKAGVAGTQGELDL